MALIGVTVWIVQEPWLTVLGYTFAAYSGVVLAAMPREITGFGQLPGQWLASIVVVGLVALTFFLDVPVGLFLSLFLVGLLVRFWYIRQYHRRLGYSQSAELLRRGLLLVFWSSISVLVALYNPY